jgi:hypothetical protein
MHFNMNCFHTVISYKLDNSLLKSLLCHGEPDYSWLLS